MQNHKSIFLAIALSSLALLAIRHNERIITLFGHNSKRRLSNVDPSLFIPPYFNTEDPLLEKYPPDGPVIAILVSSREKDVVEACTALRSLVFLGGDNEDYPAPILAFNEGDLSTEQIEYIVGCTKRPISFPFVDFSVLPEGFNEHVSAKMFRVKGRSEWGYYQMIRFWVTGIWKHPAISRYETIMRIDTDSCFKERNPYLPNFAYEGIEYHSQYVGIEDGKDYTTGFLDAAEEFLKKIGKAPADPMMWDFIKQTWTRHQSLPVFRTNFELAKKSFMLRDDVMKWHESLTEYEPFGVFRYRWGDAVERFLTVAMFTNNAKLLTNYVLGYGHKQNCPAEEVEAALEKYFN